MKFGFTKEELLQYKIPNNQQNNVKRQQIATKANSSANNPNFPDEETRQKARDYIASVYNSNLANNNSVASTPNTEIPVLKQQTEQPLPSANNPNFPDEETRMKARAYIQSVYEGNLKKEEKNGAQAERKKQPPKKNNNSTKNTVKTQDTIIGNEENTDKIPASASAPSYNNEERFVGNYYNQKEAYEKKANQVKELAKIISKNKERDKNLPKEEVTARSKDLQKNYESGTANTTKLGTLSREQQKKDYNTDNSASGGVRFGNKEFTTEDAIAVNNKYADGSVDRRLNGVRLNQDLKDAKKAAKEWGKQHGLDLGGRSDFEINKERELIKSGAVSEKELNAYKNILFYGTAEEAATAGVAHLGNAFAKPVTAVAGLFNEDWKNVDKGRNEVMQYASQTHPITSLIGDFAGTAVNYNAANEILGNAIKGVGILPNILRGQIADTALDTIPTIASNANQGKYADANGNTDIGKVVLDTLGNQAVNAAFNGVMEIPELVNGIKSGDSLSQILTGKERVPRLKKVNPNNIRRIVNETADNIPTKDIEDAVADEVASEISTNNPLEETLAKEFPKYQTPEMRARQNAQTLSNRVQPIELTRLDEVSEKRAVRDYLDDYQMDEELRKSVGKNLDEVDKIIEDFNKAETQQDIQAVMDRFENVYREVGEKMDGNAKLSEDIDIGNTDARRNFRDAMTGLRIGVSNTSLAEITDANIRDLNNAIFFGRGSGKFVKNGGVPIDTVFSELDNTLGGELTRFMVNNGLDPDVTENQINGIVQYANSLKSEGKTIKNEHIAKGGELLDDLFDNMIKAASARGVDIDTNELRKRMRISDYRLNKQGIFNLTDEELNNSYFNKDNEHFAFMKGDNDADWNTASKDLARDYDSEYERLLNKPSNEQFSPKDVFEATQAYYKELDEARARGDEDYSRTAELMYRLTKDAHEHGSGLQAYSKIKSESPVGVVLDANQNARKLGEQKFSKKYMDDIDNLIKDIKKVVDSGKSYEEQAQEIERLMKELQGSKWYSNGVNGFKEMDELLKTGKNVDTATIKDIIYGANHIPNIDGKAQKEIMEIAQEMFGKELTSKEKQQYINRINMLLSEQKNWSLMDRIVEASHVIMLTGMKTHEKNFLANVGMLPVSALARKYSAIGQGVAHLINPDYMPNQAFRVSKQSKQLAREALESKGGVGAITHGVMDKYSGRLGDGIDAKYMATKLRNGNEKNAIARANDALTSKIPVLKKAEEATTAGLEKLGKKFGIENPYASMDARLPIRENIRQFIYGSLSGLEDDPFVKANFENRLASFIEARGIDNLSDIPEDAYNIAASEALKATFKDDNAVTRLFNSIKNIPVIGEVELPYVKTPANLLARSFEYSPIGLAKELYGLINKGSRFHRDSITEAIDEIAKGFSGSTIGALAMYLYANGMITGRKDDDTDVAKYMEGKGFKEYSISTKGIADFINSKLGTDIDLGDDFKALDWLQPISTDIIAAIEIFEELNDGQKLTEKSIDDIASRARSIGGSYIDSLLANSTLQDVGSLFSSEYGNNVGENLFDNVLETPARLTSGAINDLTKLADDTRREYYEKDAPIKNVVNLVKSKVPGLSKTLPAKHDVWGEESTRNQNKSQQILSVFDPMSTTHKSNNPLYDVVDAINAKSESGKYIPKTGDRSFEVINENTLEAEKKNLNPQEYSDYTDKYGDRRAEFVSRANEDERFTKFDADAQVSMLKSLDSVADYLARIEVDSNAKVGKENQKLLDIYNKRGYDGLMDYISGKAQQNAYELELASMNIPINETTKTLLANGDDKELKKWQEIQLKADDYNIQINPQIYKGYIEAANTEKDKYLRYAAAANNKEESVSARGFEAFKAGKYDSYVSDYKEILKQNGLTDSDSRYKAWNEGGRDGLEHLIRQEQAEKKEAAMYEQYGLKADEKVKETWEHASKAVPELSMQKFAKTYKELDANGKSGVSQAEILDYANRNNLNEQQINNLWNTYLTSYKKVPVLKNGVWKSK